MSVETSLPSTTPTDPAPPTIGRSVKMPSTTQHLAWARGLVTGASEPPPVAKLVGFDAQFIDLGVAVMGLTVADRHHNPMGTVHGGIVADVADAAMGIALATTLEDQESFTTLDLTASYFKPVRAGRITATGRVTRRTRSLGYIECEVTDETASLVAKVVSTCLVLRGEEAKGR
jgi:uncharacterized protein (TIGR00369 family)